ncbi:threonine--tRNA ligase, partial [Priestia megaterium]
HVEYAYKVKHELELKGYRVEVDDRIEKIGLKIREAEMQKVPYMAVIGDKEVENESLAMRKHGKKNIGTVSVEEAAVHLNKEKNSNRVY